MVAGPNGSGKSSLYGNTDIEAFDQSVWIINPDVPEDKIKGRWQKSLAQLPWFLEQADQAAIFDNSGAVPRLVGRKQNGKIIIDPDAPVPLREALGLNLQNRHT